MKLFTAPQKVVKYEELLEGKGKTIFLAGSIEQGVADKWQDRFIEKLNDEECIILNPRRESWDSSWEQSIDNEKFNEQVTWELDGIEASDIVVIYFDPNTKSPISLLELGILVDDDKELFIYCPEGFYRKGNVDIVAKRNEHKVFEDEEELITELLKSL